MGNLILSRKDADFLQSDSTLRLANAGPFQQAFGRVVITWIWIEMACFASLQMWPDVYTARLNFYRRKIQACYYLHRWEFPLVRSWLDLLEPIDTTCLDIKEGWF